jgi:ubiquinone/menaquinone biosynthesis C-methylase UbiE
MQPLKSYIKAILQKTNVLPLLDKINYKRSIWNNKKSNQLFKSQNQTFALPSDYFLYETYRLNYEQYKADGIITAKEIIDWTAKYLTETKHILEWGCGVARIIRHIPDLINATSKVVGCDINNEMTIWNKANIQGIQFDTIDYVPPTLYSNNSFDLIYAISIFTHIEDSQQQSWINEIARVLKPDGVFLFTTHGTNFFNKLSSQQLNSLHQQGSYTVPYTQKGHRMMSTYNLSDMFKKWLESSFDVLEFHEGKTNMHKVGGQDLWIVRKK